jgi:hypothetical protein
MRYSVWLQLTGRKTGGRSRHYVDTRYTTRIGQPEAEYSLLDRAVS